jgi:hypothetical protein
MGFLVTRTPGFHDFTERAAGKQSESVMRVMASHPEYFRRAVSEAGVTGFSDIEIRGRARARAGFEPATFGL